jgi:nucleoside phosphorylase
MTDRSKSLRVALVALLLAAAPWLSGCGSDSNDLAIDPRADRHFIAVLGAFPAELAALVDRAEIEEEIVIGDRVMRIGRLGGVRVVLGMTGIGLLNAERTTRVVLDRFPVTGVIGTGVAGSPHRIGDVTVPRAWELNDGTVYECDAPWLSVAEEVAASDLTLDRCTNVPATGQPVCMPYEPAVVVGGIGISDDPYGDTPLDCFPVGDNDIFGCDIAAIGSTSAARDDGTLAGPHQNERVAGDQETAAIAREATARGLPFIAFRSASDSTGEPDPLNLPGFPGQFFAYYRLAASTAAEAATAFLQRLR